MSYCAHSANIILCGQAMTMKERHKEKNMRTFDEMLRSFDGLTPLPYEAEFHNENNMGYVRNWFCRLVTEDGYDRSPVIEFYSLDTNQFVSSYYTDTFLGNDNFGGGFGTALGLWGDVPAWSLTADDADEIRIWVQNCLDDMSM